jgi:hypothetical protein
MIDIVNIFLHNSFKKRNAMQRLKSFFQLKGLGFNHFPNYFSQQTKWMKKYIKYLNYFLKLIVIRKQLPWRKEKKMPISSKLP